MEKNGSFRQKIETLRQDVKAKFDNARARILPIHDADLRRWALASAKELGLRFTACDTWILSFKRKYHISSRKATKFFASHDLHNQEAITDIADHFWQVARPIIDQYTQVTSGTQIKWASNRSYIQYARFRIPVKNTLIFTSGLLRP